MTQDRGSKFWTPIPRTSSRSGSMGLARFLPAPPSHEPLVELLVDPAGLHFRSLQWWVPIRTTDEGSAGAGVLPTHAPATCSPSRRANLKPLSTGAVRQGTLNGSASFACEEERGSSMKQDLPPVTVLATFNDRVSAEIACALLSEASIHSGEPEPAEDGTWLVSVRGVHPELAGRAEVILRSARARETTIASDAQQTAHGC